MAENIDLNAYPPGWECRFDRRSGKQYYINYLTKMTTWEDPRIRNKMQQNAPQHHPIDFVQQGAHGSPYHVYPYPSPVPLQHAFQPPIGGVHSTYSPKALPKQILYELSNRSQGSPLSGGSPVLGRGLSLSPKGSPVPSRVYSLTSKMQETGISLAADTDAMVAKISSMFPTVSETHIKILLKKYYNREAVVISALQVEKYPISTPGPFSTPPAGASRLQAAAAAAYAGAHLAHGAHLTHAAHLAQSGTPPLGGSPRASPPLRPQSGASGTYVGSPRSRPHSSPKMKLRYLKSVFPKAEETLILDMLASEENNVQRASEKLITLGYFKRETIPPRLSLTHKDSDPPKASPPPPVTPPRLKSIEDKQALKVQLQKKYSTIAEKVVSIALESVDWSEERAEQILSVVLQEDIGNKKNQEALKEQEANTEKTKTPTSSDKVAAFTTLSPVQVQSPQLSDSPCIGSTPQAPIHLDKTNRRHKNKKETAKAPNLVLPESTISNKSPYLSKAQGANPIFVKGAQDQLLLVDYITWNGANPELKSGSKVLVKGTKNYQNEGNSIPKSSHSRGSNKDLYKGPKAIVKGSIYQHINQSSSLPQMKVCGD